METISIINRKGGVGKTATAQALGAGLLRKGRRVLFVDLDSQANLSYGLGAADAEPGILEVLTGEAPAAAAILHTEQGDILPGSAALANAEALISGTGKEYRLSEKLSGLPYDYAIIDTPAALGTLTVNALTASGSVIIPVQAEIYSLQGISQLSEAIAAVKKYCNPALTIRGILITRYNGRAILSRDMLANLEAAAEQLRTWVYQTPVRECVAVKEAQASQQDIFTYAPRSNAAKDYTAFIEEFLERMAADGKEGL